VTRVVNEIRELFKAGVTPGEVLIIHAEWQASTAIDRLQHEFGPLAAVDPRCRKGNHIRVCTLNAATGLESPIVFCAACMACMSKNRAFVCPMMSALELIRDNTRKLYIYTRAGQRLV
jgi:hypothetical protein